MVEYVTDSDLETLNMELLEGCPSEKELWKMAVELLAEVTRLRSMEDATQASFDEMLADLGKARAEIKKLNERSIK